MLGTIVVSGRSPGKALTGNYEVDERKIGTPIGPAGSDGKPQSFRGLTVFGCEVLGDLNRPLPDVPHSQVVGGRALIDCAQIIELRAEASVGSVVNQNEHIKPGVIAAGWRPACHLHTVFVLPGDHICAVYLGRAPVVIKRPQCNGHTEVNPCKQW